MAHGNTKIHKLTLGECHEQGCKDGRYGFHDANLWNTLSKPKRKAYDTGNQSGRKSPIRC